jgi:hypothetical protein
MFVFFQPLLVFNLSILNSTPKPADAVVRCLPAGRQVITDD